MDFFLIDKDEFSLNGMNVKLGKRIVRYEVFDKYDIVVLLVSNTDDWEKADEIIAIKHIDHNYQTIWIYQRKDTVGQTFSIYTIWSVKQKDDERIACFINSLGFYDETNIIDVETGEIIDTQLSK